jgi:hypothetical protein
MHLPCPAFRSWTRSAFANFCPPFRNAAKLLYSVSTTSQCRLLCLQDMRTYAFSQTSNTERTLIMATRERERRTVFIDFVWQWVRTRLNLVPSCCSRSRIQPIYHGSSCDRSRHRSAASDCDRRLWLAQMRAYVCAHSVVEGVDKEYASRQAQKSRA